MSIKVALNHRSHWRYDKPVSLGPQIVRLRPAPHSRTPILNYSMKVIPAKHSLSWQQDPLSNFQARLLFSEKTREFLVEVDMIAELSPINPFDYFLELGSETYPFEYSAALARDLAPYRVTEEAGPLLKGFLDRVSREKRGTLSFLVDLNHHVRDQIGYVVRLESGIQTCEQTLDLGAGSCRDSAWLLVQILRQLGLAARFVSGYLIQLADEKSGSDSVDLHAWAEVYLPGAGWIGLDPTSGLMATEGHIPLACAPDFLDASPITGSVEPSQVDFKYEMSVRRIEDAPPVTKTYTDEQWKEVRKLAHSVDKDLSDNDVRLTMGGEPTFVGIDEPDSPQWNGDAMGPLKKIRAITLIRSVQEKIAPGALLHFGQGKWYPSEALPRWALNCYWRQDGVPLWEHGDLIAGEEDDNGFSTGDALQFVQALTQRLEVSVKNVLPAYEDAFYYLWKERRLPVNVDVSDSKLANPREREELARAFERGLMQPVGYVLPIRRRQHEGRIYWSSELWFLRPERLLLIQGDSPVGYRLPLDSLPWVSPDDIEYEYESDPFADHERLPAAPARRMDLFTRTPQEDPLPSDPQTSDSSKSVVRPALAVEARGGRLHVFLPYLTKLPDYLDLLAAVEDTCQYLKMPIWIEGYGPPSDPRLKSFSVTPDPGVIEVNLPPASTWDELEQLNTLVFEEAGKHRLTAEKFQYDGRHTATGGGNHIVLGGSTPADSPLLRKPALLRSMITFWQNHPSLSYLFAGSFIGPTSQYPRVDEARMDSLYELEIAFDQIPQGECPPWLVDRLFRNLLVDVAGNTHRAEFCIDKLYPPESSGMRLGLLELRSFEMAPNVGMELVLLLLIRALVAAFWKQPFAGRFIRWGTDLHDRFLLPHFAKQDFLEVLEYLERSGYKFEWQWFRPQFEFRFPKIGSIAAQGVAIALRQALETWNVLGEEASSSGTSRSVDSSLDRLQVKVSGLTDRYAIACNGRRVPLHPTGKPGEAVAGVRYRAWLPTSCLHPTIPVHTPLVFDIVDQWNDLVVGGATFHGSNPNGQTYSTRPANSAEAEGRRAERFESTYAAARTTVLEEEPNPFFPMTLDLRWPKP
ncbi:MAG: transglutaminase family protein [Bryobacteraceae bacterium]